MSGSIQNTVILAKLEVTSGTDSAPTNIADAVAVRVSNLSAKINQNFAERDVIVGAFGAPDKLPFSRRGAIAFSCELQASGALGTAPQWGDLLQGCGFSETITAAARVDYTPASTALKTLTIWAYINGRLEKFAFCAGTVKMNLKVGELPSLDFTFTGLVSSTVASATVTPTLTPWIRAEAVGPAFTTPLSIGAVTYAAGALAGGTPYPFQSLAVDMACDVQDIALVQTESVGIYGRNPSAQIVADLGGTAHAAFKADMHAGTTRAFGLVHGSVATKKVGIYAPVGVLTSVEDQISGSVMLDQLGLTLRPNLGNDEFRIFCI
jgi:hypothetical protein